MKFGSPSDGRGNHDCQNHQQLYEETSEALEKLFADLTSEVASSFESSSCKEPSSHLEEKYSPEAIFQVIRQCK